MSDLLTHAEYQALAGDLNPHVRPLLMGNITRAVARS